ncbi:MAG: hypothetical protein H6832_17870 [Planctomycetes bacterium]|nr:hypothetical protein [Planctomycetota bacterium]MCB9920274.1 hypothetical protein [Planctomycetota bacterium]
MSPVDEFDLEPFGGDSVDGDSVDGDSVDGDSVDGDSVCGRDRDGGAHDGTLDAAASSEAEAQRAARQLFAHALLLASAEHTRTGAGGRDARTRAILDRIRDEATFAPERAGGTLARRIAWRWLAAAALLLAATVLVYWPSGGPTQAWADELAGRALTHASTTRNVYDLDVAFVHEGATVLTKWEAALAAENRFHIRLLDGGGFLPRGIEFGSDGKSLWAKSRVGSAFELPFHDPAMLPWANVGPEIAYYELRPFLEASHGNLRLRLLGFEGERRGERIVTLGGPYDRRIEHARPRYDAENRRWTTTVDVIEVEGNIRLSIDEASGQLLHLHKTHIPKGKPASGGPIASRVTIDLKRRTASGSADDAAFDFDPPRLRTPPLLKATMWFGTLGRSAAEAVRRKRARETDR